MFFCFWNIYCLEQMLIHLVHCFNILYLLCAVPFLWKGGHSMATCSLRFDNFVACLTRTSWPWYLKEHTNYKKPKRLLSKGWQKWYICLVRHGTTSLSRAYCYGSIFLLFSSDKTSMYWKMIFSWHNIFIMSRLLILKLSPIHLWGKASL